MLVTLYYRWYVAADGVRDDGLVAVALVLGDVVLSLFINSVCSADARVVDADEVEAVGRRHRSAGPPVARR
jgi:hypothetical protein